jgi:alkylated DNA repair dioxygenase AlkB
MSLLFNDNILSQDGTVLFYPDFFSSQESQLFFETLEKTIYWRQEQIKYFGKLVDCPRLSAWYGDAGKTYMYSGILNQPLLWTKELLIIKTRVEELAQANFNSVLLNLYRNGKDSMGFHQDDEKELGQNPCIASVSFGGTRNFRLKHLNKTDLSYTIPLANGSALIMKDETQHFWSHGISKTSKDVAPRINLTFRQIL